MPLDEQDKRLARAVLDRLGSIDAHAEETAATARMIRLMVAIAAIAMVADFVIGFMR